MNYTMTPVLLAAPFFDISIAEPGNLPDRHASVHPTQHFLRNLIAQIPPADLLRGCAGLLLHP